MVVITPSPVVGAVDDFEARTWREALETFRTASGHKEMLDDFLAKTTTPSAVAQTCREKQRDAGSQYGKVLSKILGKIDIFISVGNLAVKGAPESIGLAWTGIQMALHSVQDDFATFQLFSGACVDIIGILITCRLFGRMFSEKDGPAELREIQDQVLDAIPKVYGNILEFSYRMTKYMGTSSLLRISKGLFQAHKSKFEGLIGSVKDGEKSMSTYATKASQALQLYYAKKSDHTQDKMVSDLAFIKESIDSNVQSSKELADFVRKELEASRKRTPMDVARDAFNSYQKQLRMIDHAPQLEKRRQLREPGTCMWMYEAEEYKTWHDTEGNQLLWMSGGGNMGKSFLVSSVIQQLQGEAKEDQGMFVHYFFCKNGDNDAQKSDRILSQILGWLYASTPPTLEIMDRCNDIIRRYLARPSSGSGGSAGKKDDKDADAEKGLPFEEAYATLCAALKKKVFLVVDALDEVADRKDEEFIQQLMKIHKQPMAQNIKIFVSSRPETDIVELLGESSRIRVEKFNEEDIKRAVGNQIQHIPGMSPSEREEACKMISDRAGPYFGYVNPALALLRQPWQRPLRKHLEQLPKNVYDMNLKILADTDPRYLNFLKTCMTWVIFANGNQKITIDEIVDAYSKVYTVEDLDWTGQELTNEAEIEFYRKQIQEAGDAFLDVNEKNKEISLIKPAIVKDSFVKNDDESGEPELDTTACEECRKREESDRVLVLTEKKGHLEIARTIFQHLNSSTFCRQYLDWEPEEKDEEEEHKEAKEAANEGASAANEDASAANEDTSAASENTTNNKADEVENMTNGVDGDSSENVENNQTLANNTTETQDGATQAPGDPDAAPQANSEPQENNQSEGLTTNQAKAEASAQSTVTTPPADEKQEPELPVDIDTFSDNDSDVGGEYWQEFPPLEDDAVEHIRYEITQGIFHLKQAELKWSQESNPPNEEYEALLVDAEKFFSSSNPAFKAWISKIWNQGEVQLSYMPDEWQSLTPLHVAITYSLYDLSKRLVERGDNIEAKTSHGRRPLHCAASIPDTSPIKYKLCKLLLEKGANPNLEPKIEGTEEQKAANDWFEPPIFSMLYYGCDLDLTKLFFEHGAKTDEKDEWGLTALHNFAFVGTDREVLALLLEHGADIKATDRTGETPLHKLLDRKEFPIGILEDFLAAGAEVNKDDNESRQPLYEAAASGNIEAAKLMLKHGADIHDDDSIGWTALHVAANAGDETMAALLVDNGTDPTKPDHTGRTPFFLACASGEITTARYLANLLREKDPSLLDKPADNGKTPFRKACGKSHTEVVRMFLTELETHIDINATDKHLGRSAVHMAAYNGSDEILNLLLDHGAKVDMLDKRDQSALQLCYENWGVRASHDPNNDGYEKCLARLIDLDRQTAVEDCNLLSTATRKGSMTILKHLLEQEPCADPNNRDDDGWTAVEIARQYRQPDAEKVLSDRGAVAGKYPGSWVTSSAKRISVDENGTTASFVSDVTGTGQGNASFQLPLWRPNYVNDCTGRFSIMSDRPIPHGLKRYYYEVTISSADLTEDGSTTCVQFNG